MRPTHLAAALFVLAGAAHADGVQEQLDKLKSELQYIKDNYERSEPVQIVKPVTEWVSPSGELFTSAQPGNVSPTDGSPLEERQTFRKIKFNRRESVSDKIDSAVNAAIDGRVAVGMELLGLYQNSVGAGDVVDPLGQTRSANRGVGAGGVNVNFTGKPMRNTLIFADFDASSGAVGLGEAWMLVQGPKKVLGLQAGIIDLGGTFDTNKVANDDTSQFISPIFVNSPLLGNPSGLGAVLRADWQRYNVALGLQDTLGASADIFDNLYWIVEAGALINFFGDSHWRVWARQQPRGAQQPDQALGLSVDHRLSTRVTAFGRYSKSSYIDAYDEAADTRFALNPLDWSASGGVELSYLLPKRLNDKVGLGYGLTEAQGGPTEQFAELYYKAQLTRNLSLSLSGQGTFSRTVAMTTDPALLDPALGGDPTLNDALPNLWTLGVRVLASY